MTESLKNAGETMRKRAIRARIAGVLGLMGLCSLLTCTLISHYQHLGAEATLACAVLAGVFGLVVAFWLGYEACRNAFVAWAKVMIQTTAKHEDMRAILRHAFYEIEFQEPETL